MLLASEKIEKQAAVAVTCSDFNFCECCVSRVDPGVSKIATSGFGVINKLLDLIFNKHPSTTKTGDRRVHGVLAAMKVTWRCDLFRECQSLSFFRPVQRLTARWYADLYSCAQHCCDARVNSFVRASDVVR
jgi:hypothetical protein